VLLYGRIATVTVRPTPIHYNVQVAQKLAVCVFMIIKILLLKELEF